MQTESSKIAVIGGGVAGITAAHLLQSRHEVTLYEAEATLGGHAHALEVDDDGSALHVDTAFLIFNTATYPLFLRLLDELGLEDAAVDSEMSMTFYDPSRNFYYSGRNGLRGLLAQPTNLFRPSFVALLREIARFKKQAEALLESEGMAEQPLGEFLRANGYSDAIGRNFIYPLCAAVWSLPGTEPEQMPALSLLRYLANHAVLRKAGARWQSLRGSSVRYVRAFEKRFGGSLRLATAVQSVVRSEKAVDVITRDGERGEFDHVVLATHADQALKALEEPTSDERRLLGQWSYRDNPTTLHCDPSPLPPARRAWSSWNLSYDVSDASRGNQITYYLNRVQRLQTERDYFVTLGEAELDDDRVLETMSFRHPVMSLEAIGTQAELPRLNGVDRVHYCGSYFGYGFHEDAIASAKNVAEGLGAPWST